MCTLFGVIGEQEETMFRSAFAKVSHRGKTNHFFLEDGEHYAYARLPTDGLRVATTVSEKPFLFLNGIITNVVDLHTLFVLDPRTSESDTLTVRDGFIRYGTDFLSRCRGMFACVFVTEDAVQLARDTLGIKPLFYAYDKKRFSYSSELKGLAALGFVKIFEVCPGEIVSYDKKTRRIHKKRFSYEGYLSNTTIRSLLHASLIVPTKRYLRQTKTKSMGLLLSGGLDSSILFHLLATELTSSEFARIVPVCVGSSSGSDKLYAKRLGEIHKKKVHMLSLHNSNYCTQHLKEFVYSVESPYARVVKVALIQDVAASFFSKQGIDVVLSGEGADELFYGYPRLIAGMSRGSVESIYRIFLRDFFPKTLLQRLDRVFSLYTIEARVPFLDQELVRYAAQLSASEKYENTDAGLITKKHLRKFALEIGLPRFFYDRPKISMTLGATGRENIETSEGYLEDLETDPVSIAHLVREYYNVFFGTLACGKNELAHDLRKQELETLKKYRQKHNEKRI